MVRSIEDGVYEGEAWRRGGGDAERTVQLTDDIHHITFLTGDMDRLTAFYERIFEAKVTLDLVEEGLRHAFIEVGPHTVLHPFQIPGRLPPGKEEMFSRGRLDHSRSGRAARRPSASSAAARSPTAPATASSPTWDRC
jgi:catechol 2,3-dioxygenase-like lactoylglutathione lyase family enzyme